MNTASISVRLSDLDTTMFGLSQTRSCISCSPFSSVACLMRLGCWLIVILGGCCPDRDPVVGEVGIEHQHLPIDIDGVNYYVFDRGEFIEHASVPNALPVSRAATLTSRRGVEALNAMRAAALYFLREASHLLQTGAWERPEALHMEGYSQQQAERVFLICATTLGLFNVQFAFNGDDVVVVGTKVGLYTDAELRSGPVGIGSGGGQHYWVLRYNLLRAAVESVRIGGPY